ncbi:hypothetical protein L0Z13_11750 [Burkholderia multivorans]|uniref:hypothetical protein n=1 Tax=Burkholderia multivorans TaxID=87883 RepID=UPI0009E0D543|nr:hypothetical protein [Burkholderia multivorans]MCO1435419.1 hypothetical protein [Burkholderia multivorans]UQN59203.1 hypothetical protein L0Y94_21595 [Burkholderia multivorans]UQN67481.1 hypothetical protein L0Y92_19760 [Burkholderia multivorans]UQO04959.1 hypothetical protein L0Z13_11425 [Burkholderia multivorans]UQO05017.1 hypothetical protein L0Z13_11750 [Burkholderia multivorans]
MNPITYLCGALDRLFERNPICAMALMIVLAFVCMIAIAYLNQDGASVTTINARYA